MKANGKIGSNGVEVSDNVEKVLKPIYTHILQSFHYIYYFLCFSCRKRLLKPLGTFTFTYSWHSLLYGKTFATEALQYNYSSYLLAYEDGTECSETSGYKIQTPGNYQEENIQHSEHGESLKSRTVVIHI